MYKMEDNGIEASMELIEKLKIDMKDPEKLLELVKEALPEHIAALTTLAREVIKKTAINGVVLDEDQAWEFVSHYWPLMIEDFVQQVAQFYEEFNEATVAVDITNLNSLVSVLEDLRPELLDSLEVLAFQGWQKCNKVVEEVKEEEVWEMLEQMWTGVATCVREEFKKRGKVGKVELKEWLVVLAHLDPEFEVIMEREWTKMNEVWAKFQNWMDGVKADRQGQSGGDKGEETDGAKKEEKKETEDTDADVVKGYEAGDASSSK